VGKFIVYAAVVIYLLVFYNKLDSIESQVWSIRSDVSSIEFASRSLIARGHRRLHGHERAPAANRTPS
jgi:hypothetical protein